MKKDTVTKFLDTSERKAKQEKDESLRKAQLEAIQRCRRWLELTWADMLGPVNEKLNTLNTEAQPLLLKEEEQALTEQDEAYLQKARAIYSIYQQFQRKISPTASRANLERRIRSREKVER